MGEPSGRIWWMMHDAAIHPKVQRYCAANGLGCRVERNPNLFAMLLSPTWRISVEGTYGQLRDFVAWHDATFPGRRFAQEYADAAFMQGGRGARRGGSWLS